MADTTLEFGTSTGKAIDVYVQSSAGLWLNSTTFEAYNAAHFASYANAMTELGATGLYQFPFPSLASDQYTMTVRKRIGVSAASTDTIIGGATRTWNGTEFVKCPGYTAGSLNPDTLATGLAFDAANTFMVDFGENITYTPFGGSPITRRAIVYRSPAQSIGGLFGASSYRHEIEIPNDSFAGVTSIKLGKDTVTFANFVGGSDEAFVVLSVIDQDTGMWHLAVG